MLLSKKCVETANLAPKELTFWIKYQFKGYVESEQHVIWRLEF